MPLRCLWLCWIDPDPEQDGEQIYSGRLIASLAGAGAEIEVLCLARSDSDKRGGDTARGVRWWPVCDCPRPGWKSLLSPLPHLAHRCSTPGMGEGLEALLGRGRWDAIVIDGLSSGWALPYLTARYPDRPARPRLVYVSHNHEASTRAQVARNYRGNPCRRAALTLDAAKVGRLEGRVLGAVDLVTAITEADATRYGRSHPGRQILVLPPGYAGRRLQQRRISATTPRRALLLGSLEWIAKQMNLREFLTVADPIFAAASGEIVVVGKGDGACLDAMRSGLAATRLTGAVESVQPYLDDARIAVVPERSGGGFKLKVLDYVFNRLPIAAFESALAGTPLAPDHSVLVYRDHRELALGAVRAMDDLDLLNSLQERAFAACARAFEWPQRGGRLLGALAAP